MIPRPFNQLYQCLLEGWRIGRDSNGDLVWAVPLEGSAGGYYEPEHMSSFFPQDVFVWEYSTI